MSPDEYEAQRQRLSADIEAARQALNRARGHYDRLCDELRELNYQQRKEGQR